MSEESIKKDECNCKSKYIVSECEKGYDNQKRK